MAKDELTRRQWLKRIALAGTGTAAVFGAASVIDRIGRTGVSPVSTIDGPEARPTDTLLGTAEAATTAHEAMYYEKLSGQRVKCQVCPNECVVGPGGRGVCGNKVNRDGRYYTLVYGRAAALNVDPVEKKPLFHFYPRSWALSVGTAGCPFTCKHCQNWEISQRLPEELERVGQVLNLPPQTLVSKAQSHNIPTIAYTYNEPISFYGYMHDTAKLARQKGVRSVMISNGYINREPMIEVCKYLDAVKIDLKGFSEEFYSQYCAGRLEPVLQTIKRVIALGKWLEIVYLVIPTVNDDPEMIRQAAEWVLRAGGPDVPLHFSRFTPAFRLKNLPPTPYDTLRQCRHIAMEVGLNYVYTGNMPGTDIASTYCPSCGEIVVKRNGFEVLGYHLKPNGACKFCGQKIAGVWA